jgi:hypothetical protein
VILNQKSQLKIDESFDRGKYHHGFPDGCDQVPIHVRQRRCLFYLMLHRCFAFVEARRLYWQQPSPGPQQYLHNATEEDEPTPPGP